MRKLLQVLLIVTLIVTNVAMIYYHKAIRSLLGYMESDLIDERGQWEQIYRLQEDLNEVYNRK